MIPIPVEEYFDDYDVCDECFSIVHDPFYFEDRIAVCRTCFDGGGYETEEEQGWMAYCDIEMETRVCY